MNDSARTVVEKMFAAFAEGDVDKIVETVSDDSLGSIMAQVIS